MFRRRYFPGRIMIWCVATIVAAAGSALIMLRRANEPTSTARDSGIRADESAGQGSAPCLSEEGRKHLWESENRAFALAYKFGPRFSRSLAESDHATLRSFFHKDFVGTVFDGNAAHVVDRGFASFRNQRRGDHPMSTRAVDGFVEQLLEFRRLFSVTPLVQLAVLRIAPVEPGRYGGAWRGMLQIRFSGVTGTTAPVAPVAIDPADLFPPRIPLSGGEPLEIIVRGSFQAERIPEDFTASGGWIRRWDFEQVQIRRAMHPLLEDVTAQSGIETENMHDNWKLDRSQFIVTPGGVYACDYNQDGKIDLLITDRGPPRLYAGLGGLRFADQSIEAGLPWDIPNSGIAQFADLDNDGDEDLILGGVLLENRKNRFVRRGMMQFRPQIVGLSVADYDRDGLVDVYASYMAPGPDRESDSRVSWVNDDSGIPNVLWRNLGQFRFADVTAAAGASAGTRSTFTSVWLDADEDGWPDLYVINELGPNVLLVNQGNGTFSERHIGPPFDGFAMGVAAGDVNNDGHVDLYVANMKSKMGQRIVANVPADVYPPDILEQMQRWVSGNMLLLNRGGWQFVESNREVDGGGWGYGPALVDLDNDGRLDIYSTCGYASFSRREPDG